MKNYLFLLFAVPALAIGEPVERTQFDKPTEGVYFRGKAQVNLSAHELARIAREQRGEVQKDSPAPGATPREGELPPLNYLSDTPGQQHAAPNPDVVPTPHVQPARAYRTLGDAAKAGVDPLNKKVVATPAKMPEESWASAIQTMLVDYGLKALIFVALSAAAVLLYFRARSRKQEAS